MDTKAFLPEIKISVVVADDHEIFLTGLAGVVRKISFVGKICTAKNGEEVLMLLKNLPISIVILDICMPILNGIETTSIIRKNYPKVKVIGISSFNDCHLVSSILNEGAKGFLLKNTTCAEIEKAISVVMGGKVYLSREVQENLNENDWIYPNKKKEFLRNNRIRELLYLICHERTTKEIAGHLNISEKTVEKYRSELMRITGAKNMVGLAVFAMKNNIHADEILNQKFESRHAI